MGTRLELQAVLEELLGTDKVYYQPPSSITMAYPCIVYHRQRENVKHAGNLPYNHTKRYKITVIDRNPDSLIPDKIGELPLCVHDAHYVAEQLNHDVYTIYF